MKVRPNTTVLDEDDRARESMLREVLQQPIVKGTIHEFFDPEIRGYVVFLEGWFSCNVIAREQLKSDPDKAFQEPSGFWWQATDDAWPDFNIEAAMRKWCEWNFPDIAVPKFELKMWTPGENK